MIMFGTAASLCGAVSLTAANAQTSGSQSPATTAPSDSNASSGTTSGPASGSPTTMGTTGTTTGTPHQLEDVRNQSSSVKRENKEGGQSGSTQSPYSSGTHQPGSNDTESGPSPPK
jgi:hypothetical protein